MPLYHFSEDPTIARFEPHVAKTSALAEPLVWAIDEWHAPMYLVPRDCPRACFWAGASTNDADRERWLAGVDARMVIAIEAAWLERIRATTLYRYTMPEDTFSSGGDIFDLPHDDSGHWMSREPVTPLRVEPVGDLLAALAEAGVELRITPRLGPLWCAVVASTLAFSGTRLRNAVGFPDEFPPTTT